ncbi:MAG: hypothetical protein NW206_20085, partial [Hyphomonadaceae bacterium]|nr:hypothetical protein [Hyphomonadaceae bacterium]
GSVRGLLKGKGYHVWERDGELVVSERTASMIGDASAIWLGYVKTLTEADAPPEPEKVHDAIRATTQAESKP